MESWVRPGTFWKTIFFAIYWGWVLVKDWSTVLIADDTVLFFAKGLSFVGLAVVLGVIAFVGQSARARLESSTWPIPAAMLLQCLVGASSLAVCAHPELPAAAVYAAWALAGAGEGLCMFEVLCCASTSDSESSVTIIHLSLFIGCLIAVFASAAAEGSVAAGASMVVLPVVGGIARVLASKADSDDSKQPEGAPVDDEEPAAERPLGSFDVKKTVEMFGVSLVGSYGLLVALQLIGPELTIFAWGGVFCAGLLAMTYSMLLNGRISMDTLELIVTGVLMVALGLLAMRNIGTQTVLGICMLLLLFGVLTFDMTNFMRTTGLYRSVDHHVSRAPVLVRFANAVGFACGWAAAYYSLSSTVTPVGVSVSHTGPILAMVVLAFIVLGCTLVPGGKSSPAAEEALPRESAWDRARDRLCDEYGLSPREREVFALFVRGRDSSYICDALFISQHTVKTHIQHIYAKSGLHSQQALISAVEDRANGLSEEKES